MARRKNAGLDDSASPFSGTAAMTVAPPAAPAEDEPHYHGHRDRLRARFLISRRRWPSGL